jgi:hypothetical protein
MSDSHHFDTHLTRFEEQKAIIGDKWSDHTYWKQLLKSCAPRVKTFLTNRESGTPVEYQTLKKVVADYDRNWWTLHNTLTPDDPPAKTESRTPRQPSTSTSGTTPKSTNPLVLAGILGPDGKLTQAEKDRRIKNNLCMGCGEPGHLAVACTKLKKAPSGSAVTSSTTTTSTTNKTNVTPGPSSSKARATFIIGGGEESQIEEVEESDIESEN